MQTRFKERAKVIDIVITALAVMLSVGTMLYGIFHYGLAETWPELVLNVFYIACVVMIWMYFFDSGITTKQFNDWCTVCVGITVLLRCSTLSVMLLCLLTYFYARKDWESYTKRNLWLIFIVDALIAILYNIDILLEPADEFTVYMLTEIWIRPTITYGLVACFVSETKKKSQTS